MACALIGGVARDCRDSFGGIIEIKVRSLASNYSASSHWSETSGVVTANSGATTSWFTYFCEVETASATENEATNIQQGTNVYSQEVKFIKNKLTTAFRNELEVLAKNKIQVAVKDANDTYWLYGYEFGLDLTASVAGTGTAREDRSGYDLTFSGKERKPIVNMSAATYTSLIT